MGLSFKHVSLVDPPLPRTGLHLSWFRQWQPLLYGKRSRVSGRLLVELESAGWHRAIFSPSFYLAHPFPRLVVAISSYRSDPRVSQMEDKALASESAALASGSLASLLGPQHPSIVSQCVNRLKSQLQSSRFLCSSVLLQSLHGWG